MRDDVTIGLAQWLPAVSATAMVNGQWWVMVNEAGSKPTITLLGGCRIVSPLGDTVVEAPRAARRETPQLYREG